MDHVENSGTVNNKVTKKIIKSAPNSPKTSKINHQNTSGVTIPKKESMFQYTRNNQNARKATTKNLQESTKIKSRKDQNTHSDEKHEPDPVQEEPIEPTKELIKCDENPSENSEVYRDQKRENCSKNLEIVQKSYFQYDKNRKIVDMFEQMSSMFDQKFVEPFMTHAKLVQPCFQPKLMIEPASKTSETAQADEEISENLPEESLRQSKPVNVADEGLRQSEAKIVPKKVLRQSEPERVADGLRQSEPATPQGESILQMVIKMLEIIVFVTVYAYAFALLLMIIYS